MRDDVTMVNECKQSTTTSSTHVKKNLQMNTFHDGLKAWMDLYRHHACPGSYLKYAFTINKAKYDNQIRESLWQSLHYWICITTLKYMAFRWWCHGNRVSYWWRREFSNYAQFQHGSMSSPAQVIMIQDNTRMGALSISSLSFTMAGDITRSISTRILSIKPQSSRSLPTRRELFCLLWDQTLTDVLPQ